MTVSVSDQSTDAAGWPTCESAPRTGAATSGCSPTQLARELDWNGPFRWTEREQGPRTRRPSNGDRPARTDGETTVDEAAQQAHRNGDMRTYGQRQLSIFLL